MAEQLIAVHSSLGIATAEAIVAAAARLRVQHGLLPLAVAVLDAGGQLVCFRRDDGCGVLRFDIAVGKAWAALGMGMSTRQIRDRLADRPSFQAALAVASQGRFIATPGGVMIVNAQHQAIGAVGISGDASDKDEFCAIEAILDAGQAEGLRAEPPSPRADWQNAGL